MISADVICDDDGHAVPLGFCVMLCGCCLAGRASVTEEWGNVLGNRHDVTLGQTIGAQCAHSVLYIRMRRLRICTVHT